MKKLTTLLVLGPGAAFAHGGHAELAGPVHDGFHAAPWIGVGLIAAALVLALIREQGK